MKPRTREQAEALLAQPRTTKPRKPPSDPEAQVGFDIDDEMSAAGFRVHDFSKKYKQAGVWVSVCTPGTPDRYYWREDGLAIWVELKAPRGNLREAQAAFIEGHRHNPIEAVSWSSLEECQRWLDGYAKATR